MSEAVEKNPIEDLIQHSLDQDYNKANEIFGSVIGTKLDDALEQEKIKMANSVITERKMMRNNSTLTLSPTTIQILKNLPPIKILKRSDQKLTMKQRAAMKRKRK